MLKGMFESQRSILALRKRTGCNEFSVAVEQGKERLVRITYDAKGKSTVKPVTEWYPVGELNAVIETINQG